MSNIGEFVEEQRKKFKKVKAPIVERWNTRVVPRGLQTLGKSGAQAYIESYGKGIAAPKVVELAQCAESMGANEMAAGFWEVAFNLTTGESAAFSISGTSTPSSAPITVASKQRENLPGFPENMQPGSIQPMQPTDALEPQSHYVLNSAYWGQPKRDGQKDVLFATPQACLHQSRSTSLLGGIHPHFEEAATNAAKEIGAFILEGERYYLSAAGSEHRTAAQAATANIEAGKGEVQPIPVYGAFKALFAGGKDLRNSDEGTRIDAATGIVALLHSYLPADGARIEAVPTARTTSEKQEMASRQKSEGREGEVWTLRSCTYSGGKSHKTDAVRTKYLQEDEFFITNLTPSTAKGRPFGAMELTNLSGKPVGAAGTGFDAFTMLDIVSACQTNPGKVKVKIRFQGYTETGILWHARFLSLV